MESVGPLLLIFFGVLPGLVSVGAAYALWRQHRILEQEEVQRYVGYGYLYLAVFVLGGIIVSGRYQDADPRLIAFGWIGAPVLTAVLGLVVFAERQRVSQEAFPTPRRMRKLSVENRQELRYVATELANDLNRALGAQESLQRGGAIGRSGVTAEDIERVTGRLRSAIRKTNELEARYGPHLRRLREIIDNPEYDVQPWTDIQEEIVDELRSAQHELDRSYDRMLDVAVELRGATNRVLAQVTTISRSTEPPTP